MVEMALFMHVSHVVAAPLAGSRVASKHH